MESNYRKEWIDIIKGIGIIAIVGGHALIRNYINLFGLLSMFMVPLFFFSAGLTYSRKPYFYFVWNKIKRIYIPFVAVNSFLILINYNFPFSNHHYGNPDLMKAIKLTIIGDIVLDLELPSWFLVCIFLVYFV